MYATIPGGLTIGYEHGLGPFSKLIEYRSAGGPSHATTLVAPGEVIDARLIGGVKRRPVSYLNSRLMDWYRLPLPEGKVRDVISFLDIQCGQPYAWLDIIAFAVPALFKKVTGAKHPWMCSWIQIGAEVKGGALPDISATVELERLTPNDLLLMNLAAGAVKIPGPIFA